MLLFVWFLAVALVKGADTVLSVAPTPAAEEAGKRHIRAARKVQETQITECTMFRVETRYRNYAENSYHWECELNPSDADGIKGKLVKLETSYPNDIVEDNDSGISLESGVTVIHAQITVSGRKAFVHGPVSFSQRFGQHVWQRRLRTTGTRSVLVVRVDAEDVSSTLSEEDLAREIFGIEDNNGNMDIFNLVSGYRQCSFDQLKFEPATHDRVVNGVYTAHISKRVVGNIKEEIIRPAVMGKLKSDLGHDLESQFDHVMICLPPGTIGDWIAYAYINGFLSVFNDKWCASPSSQMHEIGHNLGLYHSNGPFGQMYQDETGMMGYSYLSDDAPVMCFNNVKHWQLGWFQDRHVTINPLEQNVWHGDIISFVDYSNNPRRKPVILKIEGHDRDYYIGFNRKAGINAGNVDADAANKVTIQSTERSAIKSDSQHDANLASGDIFEIPDFGATPDRVLVMVDYITLAANPPVANILVMVDNGCGGDCNSESSISVVLYTDRYPRETIWRITGICDGDEGITVMSGDGYTERFIRHEETVVVPSSMYKFTISDTYGDGICCGQGGKGFYEVIYNDEVVAEGGDFGRGESVTFGSCEDPATAMPSRSPSYTPSVIPTVCEIRYELVLLTSVTGSEITWEMKYDEDRSLVAASSGPNLYKSSNAYAESGCLSDNCYRFSIMTADGNGMGSSGFYFLKINGFEIVRGGDFGSIETTIFGTCVPLQ